MNRQATILIVDDNATNLGVLFTSLQEANYHVLVAQDGESALERLRYTKPDLVLLDVMMPGINGFETLEAIKKNPATATIPIIFMTALDRVDAQVKGLTLGAVDYILKPIRVELVLARIKNQLALRQMQLDLEEQNSELEAYAHTVAHDLKGPLSIAQGFTELLTLPGVNLDQQEYSNYLHMLSDSINKQISIIDELLLFSAIRKEDVTLEPLAMDLILANVTARMQGLINEYQGQVFMPDNWPNALGHAAWIEEVWCNYISNALKYGGNPPHVKLGCSPGDNGQITFWVEDNGQGIPAEAQNHLFQEHKRLRRHHAQGHGLGLTIVKRIAEKLNGTVGLVSQPGKGSRFFFTLQAAG